MTLAPAWLLYWQPGTDRFWRLDEVEPLRRSAAHRRDQLRRDADRRRVRGGRPLLDGWRGSARRATRPRRARRLVPGSPRRARAASPPATSSRSAPARRWRPTAARRWSDCGLIVIDRATGPRRHSRRPSRPTRRPPIEVFDNPANYGFPSMISAISPDGRYSPIMVIDTDQDYGVIDLTTGEFIQLGDQPESSLWWSPDSRSAMYLVNGHLMLYDFDTRRDLRGVDRLVPAAGFRRPPASSVGDDDGSHRSAAGWWRPRLWCRRSRSESVGCSGGAGRTTFTGEAVRSPRRCRLPWPGRRCRRSRATLAEHDQCRRNGRRHVHVDRRAAAFAHPRRRGAIGPVVELDTATGQLAELAAERAYDEPPQVDAGPDWFLVRRTDTSFSQLFRRGRAGADPHRETPVRCSSSPVPTASGE